MNKKTRQILDSKIDALREARVSLKELLENEVHEARLSTALAIQIMARAMMSPENEARRYLINTANPDKRYIWFD